MLPEAVFCHEVSHTPLVADPLMLLWPHITQVAILCPIIFDVPLRAASNLL